MKQGLQLIHLFMAFSFYLCFISISRLEADIKRLKIDLQSSRQTEQDLRSQVTTHQLAEKSIRCELAQCQKDNEELQAK